MSEKTNHLRRRVVSSTTYNFTHEQTKTLLTLLKNELFKACDQYFRCGHDLQERINDLVSIIKVIEPGFTLTDWSLRLNG